MATIQATVATKNNGNTKIVTWTPVADAADVGVPIEPGEWDRVCVQLLGTLGTTPVVMIEGSNDGVDYLQLKDVHGTALSAAATKVPLQLAEVPLYIRPRLVSTGGGTSINVVMVMRRGNQSRQ